MQKSRSTLFGIIFISIVFVAFSNPFQFKKYICVLPREYSISQIDSRFKLTQDQIVVVAKDGDKQWQTDIGQEIFRYNPDSKLKINFIYDDRQAELDKVNVELAKLDAEVKKLESSANGITPRKQAYDKRLATYTIQLNQYTAEVNKVNAQGGADSVTYNRLETERKALNTEKIALDTEQKAINALAETHNGQVEQYQTEVDAFNQYQEKRRGLIQTQGLYHAKSGAYDWIDIYMFDTKKNLQSVMMHELGHSLELDHVSDPGSLMSAVTSDAIESNPHLTPKDIELFNATCKIKLPAKWFSWVYKIARY